MSLLERFNSDQMIKAYNDSELPLSVILRESFVYIRNNMTEMLYSKGVINHMNATDFIWVLTVPAIWSDAAKSIMRKAAFDGILYN